MKVRALSSFEASHFLRTAKGADSPFSPGWVPEKPGRLFVCETGDQPSGWLLALPVLSKPGRGCLSNIWVDPAYRNQGVASSLVQAGIDWAVDHQLDAIELWVREHNTRARRLYYRLGFRETGWMRSSEDPEKDPCVHMLQLLPVPATVAA
jgi:ribosomal protein S18 acetylase RimI-like enzyme